MEDHFKGSTVQSCVWRKQSEHFKYIFFPCMKLNAALRGVSPRWPVFSTITSHILAVPYKASNDQVISTNHHRDISKMLNIAYVDWRRPVQSQFNSVQSQQTAGEPQKYILYITFTVNLDQAGLLSPKNNVFYAPSMLLHSFKLQLFSHYL